jgi:hypothetical protein
VRSKRTVPLVLSLARLPVPLFLLAASLVMLVIRLVGIVREFRRDSKAAARGALWTVIPVAISSVTAAIMIALPLLPLDGIGTVQTTPRKFADCMTGRRGLSIVSGRLRDGHLQFDWIGGPAWDNPIQDESVGRVDEQIRLYVYPAPRPQRNVDVVFVSLDGVASTAAFGTTDRSHLYDVGDPRGIQLGDSAGCVRELLGPPTLERSRGVEYDTGSWVRRFYGFSDDGRVQWIGYAFGAPVVTRLELARRLMPIGDIAMFICVLCVFTMCFGRALTKVIRAFASRSNAPEAASESDAAPAAAERNHSPFSPFDIGNLP